MRGALAGVGSPGLCRIALPPGRARASAHAKGTCAASPLTAGSAFFFQVARPLLSLLRARGASLCLAGCN